MSPATRIRLSRLIGARREFAPVRAGDLSDVLVGALSDPNALSPEPPVGEPSPPSRAGYVLARVENLACQTSFDVDTGRGRVVLNLSTIPESAFEQAMTIIRSVIRSGLGMGRYIKVEKPLPGKPDGRVLLGTISSVSMDGLLVSQGIPVSAIFGGLVEMRKNTPLRFTQIIHYNATTIDPMEIFIKGRMTSVHSAAETGTGIIGAGFREIPASALPFLRTIKEALERLGIGGMLLLGEPGRPVLDIPVAATRVGLIVTAGLNPVAAIEEFGIVTSSVAMSFPFDFNNLDAVH